MNPLMKLFGIPSPPQTPQPRPQPLGRLAPRYIINCIGRYQVALQRATTETEALLIRSIIHDLETTLSLLTT